MHCCEQNVNIKPSQDIVYLSMINIQYLWVDPLTVVLES